MHKRLFRRPFCMSHGLILAPTFNPCIVQVCSGEATAAKITSWAKIKYTGKLRLKVGQPSLATTYLQPPTMQVQHACEHAAEALPCAADQEHA